MPRPSIIHEMLHSLGLGENPPTSYHITNGSSPAVGPEAAP